MSMLNFFGVLILILCISLLGTVHLLAVGFRYFHLRNPIEYFEQWRLHCFVGSTKPDGYFYFALRECHYSSMDLDDLEFIDRHIFDKFEYLRYNSTSNSYIGYTDYGIKNAKRLTKEGGAERQHTNLDGYCRPNALQYLEKILDKTAKPTIRIRSAPRGSRKHTSMLVCSAYDFYPRGIKLTWLRDGKEVTSDVTNTEELANGNWFYQIHSHLEYTPKSGETISCKVEHASLPEGSEVKWDPNMSEVSRNKVIIGASGLVLGLIITIAGVIYYKKKSTGRILVPTS